MKQPEIIAVTLSNGDAAVFVNADAVIQLDASESGMDPVKVGESMAKALGVEMTHINMDTPLSDDWSWNEVYELLPPAEKTSSPDESCTPVAYWDSQVYGAQMGEVGMDKPFLMSISDQRETSGQCYIDVAPVDGHVDDIMCATIEISRLPGSGDDVQCLHLHFDGDNLAASFFKQGDAYIVRPEVGVTIRNTTLPNGEKAWVLS